MRRSVSIFVAAAMVAASAVAWTAPAQAASRAAPMSPVAAESAGEVTKVHYRRHHRARVYYYNYPFYFGFPFAFVPQHRYYRRHHWDDRYYWDDGRRRGHGCAAQGERLVCPR
jgi:hypothetical protein